MSYLTRSFRVLGIGNLNSEIDSSFQIVSESLCADCRSQAIDGALAESDQGAKDKKEVNSGCDFITVGCASSKRAFDTPQKYFFESFNSLA
jgi:hypothetical protein